MLLAASALHAQSLPENSPTPRAMTLQESLAFAAEHRPSIAAARARLEAARSERQLAGGLWLPRVGATAQALEGTANNSSASYFATGTVDIPRIGGTKDAPAADWAPSPSTFVGVGLRQELFDFGRIGALASSYDAAEQTAAARADSERLDVAELVEESFYGVRTAKAVLEAALGAEKRASLHRDQASAGVNSGMRSPIELTRAEADLARFQVGSLRAAGDVEIARVAFAAAVGVADQSLDVAGADPLPEPAPNLSSLSTLAERDPAVRAAHALLTQQEGMTRVARAELLPDLFLSAGINARAGGATPSSGQLPAGNGYLPDIPNWAVGIVLGWTIFDATSLARISASQESEAARTADESQARLRFSGAVQQANALLHVATVSLPALQRAAEAAAANDAQADARFKAGLGNSVELADAEALRLQAEIDLAVGRFEQARARAHLARALAEHL